MLRSGYTSETILRDLSARHFADKVDPTAEKQLREANASPALLDALKSGNNAASPAEVAQARKKTTNGNISTSPSRSRELGKGLTGSQAPTVLSTGDIVNYAPATPRKNTKIVVAPAPTTLGALDPPSALARTKAQSDTSRVSAARQHYQALGREIEALLNQYEAALPDLDRLDDALQRTLARSHSPAGRDANQSQADAERAQIQAKQVLDAKAKLDVLDRKITVLLSEYKQEEDALNAAQHDAGIAQGAPRIMRLAATEDSHAVDDIIIREEDVKRAADEARMEMDHAVNNARDDGRRGAPGPVGGDNAVLNAYDEGRRESYGAPGP